MLDWDVGKNPMAKIRNEAGISFHRLEEFEGFFFNHRGWSIEKFWIEVPLNGNGFGNAAADLMERVGPVKANGMGFEGNKLFNKMRGCAGEENNGEGLYRFDNLLEVGKGKMDKLCTREETCP